ncbi:sensor domain-containing phosphodiesterase [Spartinivicinus ruber]|uniref:sensor domain-containing phosphodiesterase n=1 Tax=Spartinivicinus ruber TaxID=2683272 RepID=UPI0013D23EDC|nr:EAL domain-containing protein [Spartinivicinus ruber]
MDKYTDIDYKPAPIPSFEFERIKDLKRLDILDTEAEDRFDSLTSLIADIFNVPIALVSLVDTHRQWFKSACGLNVSQTPRDISFCGHAIFESEILVVENAVEDKRFSKNPLVIDKPFIRFYAGAVLRGPRKQPVGTCCIIDYKARSFSDKDRKHLLVFSHLIENELHKTFKILQLKNECISNAYFNSVTHLPSQKLFLDRLEHSIVNHSVNDHIVICVVNIRRFSNLINAWGKEWGDHVLVNVAKRLGSSLNRKFTVAHLDSDKFAILAIEDCSKNTCELLPEKIHSLFEYPLRINEKPLHLKLKIGVSQFPKNGRTAYELLENARICAKSVGVGGDTNTFSNNKSKELSRHFNIEQGLQKALKDSHLYLVYQPIVDIETEQLVGLETLIRWNDPAEGELSPVEFIPVAEETELIIPIGKWLLETVCEQLKQWSSIKNISSPILVTVNLSSVQLLDDSSLHFIKSISKDKEINKSSLQFEITESSIFSNFELAIANIEKMVEYGFKFLIDDFGTGYSSLSYLQRLPIYKIKLDRSFIQYIDKNRTDSVLARNIIALSHDLGLAVVAEGVESSSQLAILRDYGCDQVQGYLYSKPLKADIITDLFKKGCTNFKCIN